MSRTAPYVGWAGLVFGFVALLLYIVLPERPLWPMTFALLAALNLVTFAAVDRHNLKRALRTRQAMYGMNAAVLILVFAGILIFVNILAHRHKARFDVTETGYYTLAPQTGKITSSLPRPVKMTAFFQSDDPKKTEFQHLVDGYLGLTDQIELTYIDPDKNPAITKQYGVTTYGTVVLESGKQVHKVQNTTEENLTNGLLNVIRDKQKTVYFLEGHGERAIDDGEKEGFSETKEELEKSNFEVQKLMLLTTGRVPDDASLLIISGPQKALQPQEIEALEEYLNRGGSLLVLVDPQTDPGLTDFLARWGVALKDDIVLDPVSRLLGGDSAAPVVSQYADHGITKDFTLPTIFPLLRSVTAIETEGLKTTEVLFTGENAWSEINFQSGKARYNPEEDLKGPLPVAVAVTKNLESGNGKSQQQDESETDQQEKPSEQPVKKANLVVVGDSDFASNQYNQFSGNQDFFLNTASWLMEEEEMISIRPRERKASPLPLTKTQGSLVFIIGSVVLPLLTAVTGVRIWWKRRSL